MYHLLIITLMLLITYFKVLKKTIIGYFENSNFKVYIARYCSFKNTLLMLKFGDFITLSSNIYLSV